MLPKKIQRQNDPPNETGTAYKRPEDIGENAGNKRLLAERLAGQHEMMEGQSADMALLDRTDKADWPEIECVDTEPSILPDGKQ